MGCDYYIDTDLIVYYKNEPNYNATYILLHQERGYFYEISIDSDEEGYNEKIQEQLKPRMKPIVIYKDDVFSKPIFEEKYKDRIIHYLPEDKTWTDIAKVVKKESRYERD
jgi:hypothetical protein